MAKLTCADNSDCGPGGKSYLFFCPGCDTYHRFDVRTDGGRPNWSFNGDMQKPTFAPSLLYPDLRCHLCLTDGRIQFLSDCTHELAGQTVDVPEMFGDA